MADSGSPAHSIAADYVGGVEIVWAKGDPCEALRESGEWLPATIEKVFKKGTHIILWGDCGGQLDTCTVEKCVCKGTKAGGGGASGKPLVAAQRRRADDEPPAKRRCVVNEDDDDSSCFLP